jgi:two-component system OmpR family sensor kinase
MQRLTLSQRVTMFITLGFAVVWVAALLLMTSVLWAEQEELFDQQLAETAYVLLPLQSHVESAGLAGLAPPQPSPDPEESFLFRLVASDGTVLRQSRLAHAVAYPDPLTAWPDQIAATPGYRVLTTEFNGAGHALQLAAPMAERYEAFYEGLGAFLLPMLAVMPLTWLLVGWISRRALAPMRELSAQIATRDGNRLAPIDASDWPVDLVQIAGTLNGFMARLSHALDAERAFATNAAHELRTPVAIALAQVQEMREAATPRQMARIDALERALQRMRRLVARLLQLARADAGIGHSAEPHDIAGLTRLALEDILPRAAEARLEVSLPPGPIPALIDQDAYAIVLGNLVDNALQHGPPDGRVMVRVRPDATLEVTNGGPEVPDLAALPRRFGRRGGDGFGLGLHICSQIVEQAGGRFDLISPLPGQHEGFMVRVTLMPGPAAA